VRFYQLAHTRRTNEGESNVASGRTSRNGCSSATTLRVANGIWFFERHAHRVMVLDVRTPPATGHLTGERAKAAMLNALFDRSRGPVMCLLVARRRNALEAHLTTWAERVGETLASEQARQDVQQAGTFADRQFAQALSRRGWPPNLRGRDMAELDCARPALAMYAQRRLLLCARRMRGRGTQQLLRCFPAL